MGDVSWTVPTIGFETATFVPGVAPHTWQAAALAGTSIGQRGMLVASKALALTAIDLFTTPSLVAAAREDFDRKLVGKKYQTLVRRTKTTAQLPRQLADDAREQGDQDVSS